VRDSGPATRPQLGEHLIGGRASHGTSGSGARAGGLPSIQRRAALEGRGSWGTPRGGHQEHVGRQGQGRGVWTASLGPAQRPEKRGQGCPGYRERSSRGREVKAKGAERGGKATRRAGLPGRGGTRPASATGPGAPRTPTRARRSRPCPRGAGNEERPRPKGPVTRDRPNRTRPAAPPSSLLSLPSLPSSVPRPVIPRPPHSPAAAPEPAAASAAACAAAAAAAAAASLLRPSPVGSLRVPPPLPLPLPPEQNTPKWRHFRHLPPAGRAGEEGEGGQRERTTAAPPSLRIRVPALQRPLGLGSGEAAARKPPASGGALSPASRGGASLCL
jgi:hypothetical protein